MITLPRRRAYRKKGSSTPEAVTVRVTAAAVERLDAWLQRHAHRPTRRGELVAAIIMGALSEAGFERIGALNLETEPQTETPDHADVS
jgi:hypothetical protein